MKRFLLSITALSLVACSPIKTVSTDGETARIQLHTSLTTGTDSACANAVYEAQRYLDRTGHKRIIVINSGFTPFKSADKETLNALMED